MELTEVLRGGRQCDMDGVEIIMSRQACVEAADEIDRLHALIAKACERMDRARGILTDGNPRPECNWGMLDTSDLVPNAPGKPTAANEPNEGENA